MTAVPRPDYCWSRVRVRPDCGWIRVGLGLVYSWIKVGASWEHGQSMIRERDS